MTPSTTPTNATFSPTSLQTPRTNGHHFQDAFSPYMQQQYAPTPTQAHPDFTDFQPLAQENLQPFYDNSQSFQSSRPRQELQSSFSMSALDKGSKHGQNQNPSFEFTESFQIQTPPPTRDASKRRSQRTQSVVFGTPSSIETRTAPNQQPLRANPTLQPSPLHARQMSMNNPQYLQSAPATAPIMTNQNQLFWDPSFVPDQPQQQSQQQTQWTPLDDPFTFHPHPAAHHARSNMSSHTRAQSFTAPTQSMRPFADQNATLNSNNMFGSTLDNRAQPVPNMMSTGSGVNPSLLYTSPGRFMANSMSRPMGMQTSHSTSSLSMPSQNDRPEDVLAEMKSARFAAASLGSDQNRPGVRRSNTTGNSRPTSMYGCVESLSRSNTTANVPRRSSPLKRVTRNSLSSIAETLPPRPRTSVVLTVDSKGRARAETRVLDPSPTKALKSRYPNLWDDSDDDSDSDHSTQFSNQNASFSSSRTAERHSKVARLEPSLEGLEGLHLPRSNSSASMRATPSKAAYAAAAQLRRQSSVKKPQHHPSHTRRNTMQSLNNSFTDLPSMTSSSEDMSLGDAGAALRQAMEGRGAPSFGMSSSILSRHHHS